MNIPILYEDKDIVAIFKPVGLVVHSDGKTNEPTLTDWILEKFPEAKNIGEPARTSNGKEILRPGIVHRLDRETSGVMLVCKTQAGFETLKKQFQEHTIKKIYHTFVFGQMKSEIKNGKPVEWMRIDRPIGRSSTDFRKWSAQRGSRGERREAVTDYRILFSTPDYSFVEAMPKTGRTHQIRVHFKAIHHPLLADSLYAPNKENNLGFDRLALHSQSVTFQDVSGLEHTVTAPYPADFERASEIFLANAKTLSRA